MVSLLSLVALLSQYPLNSCRTCNSSLLTSSIQNNIEISNYKNVIQITFWFCLLTFEWLLNPKWGTLRFLEEAVIQFFYLCLRLGFFLLWCVWREGEGRSSVKVPIVLMSQVLTSILKELYKKYL